tara:strand:+ start:594 stop:1013 length:420 start_codon:yes stop_codon:yes gene_type:complete
MEDKFKGLPYPIIRTVRGYFKTQSGVDQIKADMLQLLLTNPGERVMLPDFGTPLKELFFEPNDTTIFARAREIIIQSIERWEPRISVDQIEVGPAPDEILNAADPGDDQEHILYIKILFKDPENISQVEELVLILPVGG